MREKGSAFVLLAAGLTAGAFLGAAETGVAGEPSRAEVALGRTLFQREFRPNDVRCHNGDGLGPVSNSVSCVACHNLGGSGGAGSNRNNVLLVTPLSLGGDCTPGSSQAALLTEKIRLQSGLPTPGSTVVHKFGTSPGFSEWRKWLLGKTYDGFELAQSERNTPPLFGAGLIDSIPDAALETEARKQAAKSQTPHGRVARLKDGRAGKFGWKGQMASLDDFVRTACSAELGLEVPGHHQSVDLSDGPAKPAELDLTDAECRALVAYVVSLPVPSLKLPRRSSELNSAFDGGALFKTIGCAHCHVPTLGEVSGLYSDLLLHDMGAANAGSGSYNSPGSETPEPSTAPLDVIAGTTEEPKPKPLGATSREWRTPPLWGLLTSSPYMHDGKARTIEAAIVRHGGEAEKSRGQYLGLTGAQKQNLRKFFGTLAAPSTAERLPAAVIHSSEKAPEPARPKHQEHRRMRPLNMAGGCNFM